jgi:hypothetical protein
MGVAGACVARAPCGRGRVGDVGGRPFLTCSREADADAKALPANVVMATRPRTAARALGNERTCGTDSPWSDVPKEVRPEVSWLRRRGACVRRTQSPCQLRSACMDVFSHEGSVERCETLELERDTRTIRARRARCIATAWNAATTSIDVASRRDLAARDHPPLCRGVSEHRGVFDELAWVKADKRLPALRRPGSLLGSEGSGRLSSSANRPRISRKPGGFP